MNAQPPLYDILAYKLKNVPMIRVCARFANGSGHRQIDAPVTRESDYTDRSFVKRLIDKLDLQFMPQLSCTIEPGDAYTLSILGGN